MNIKSRLDRLEALISPPPSDDDEPRCLIVLPDNGRHAEITAGLPHVTRGRGFELWIVPPGSPPGWCPPSAAK
jgi:hypothetical protein